MLASRKGEEASQSVQAAQRSAVLRYDKGAVQRISISVRQEFRFWDEAQERATITDWAGYLSVDWCFNRMLFVAHLEEVSYCIVQVLSF